MSIAKLNTAKPKTVLLVIDMLEDFINGPLGNERSRALVPQVKALADRLRAVGIPVIHCTDRHIKGIDKELDLWGEHAMEGTRGAEIVAGLLKDGDRVVPKRRYSGFFQTDLDLLLRELGADTVILCGLYTNMCVRHTAADAYMLGYNIILASEATCSMTDEEYESGVEYFKTCYAAEICTNDEIIKQTI